MLTTWIAGMTLGGCTAARWYLDRTSRRDSEHAGGWVKLKTLWNEEAAFGLPVKPRALTAASASFLTLLWTRRKEHPVGTGLVLGGGLSNLMERLLHGRVYDYIQFSKAPGRLKRYVYNLADLAILLGGIGLLLRKKK